MGSLWDALLKKLFAPFRSDEYELLIARFSFFLFDFDIRQYQNKVNSEVFVMTKYNTLTFIYYFHCFNCCFTC